MKTKRTYTEIIISSSHDFLVTDRLGRKVGCATTIDTSTFEELPESFTGYGYSSMKPGIYFTFYGQATRNGESYGASQRTMYFATQAEAEAQREKYLDGARKRAMKQFSQAGA